MYSGLEFWFIAENSKIFYLFWEEGLGEVGGNESIKLQIKLYHGNVFFYIIRWTLVFGQIRIFLWKVWYNLQAI